MQNRSNSGIPLQREYCPIRLDPTFPVVSGRHSPKTTTLSYLHQHDHLEIGYCHRGVGVFVVETKVMPFAAGDVSVISDREMHLAQSAAGAPSEWTFVTLDPGRLIPASAEGREILSVGALSGPSFENVLRASLHPGVCELVADLVEEMERRERGYRESVRGLVWVLMARFHRLVGQGGTHAELGRRDAVERIAPALDHVAEAYAGSIQLSDLVALCHTSPSNLRRLFHAATGRSPQEYVVNFRVQMAATLLETTTRSVSAIAAEVGYRTLSSFNRHFRRCMGVSPRQWRKGEH